MKRKRKLLFIGSIIILVFGLILMLPSLYSAINSRSGFFQTMGSLFGGDLTEPDGFTWSRGGFEGTTYAFAAINALSIIIGFFLTATGIIGIIYNQRRSKIR